MKYFMYVTGAAREDGVYSVILGRGWCEGGGGGERVWEGGWLRGMFKFKGSGFIGRRSFLFGLGLDAGGGIGLWGWLGGERATYYITLPPIPPGRGWLGAVSVGGEGRRWGGRGILH